MQAEEAKAPKRSDIGMVPNAEPLHKRALRVAMETFEFVFGSSRSRGVDPAAVAACESS